MSPSSRIIPRGHTQLRINPGIKGLNYLLGSVPTWISFKEKEKADVCGLRGGVHGLYLDVLCCTHLPTINPQVFNSIIQEMWPYIDKAVASSVKVGACMKQPHNCLQLVCMSSTTTTTTPVHVHLSIMKLLSNHQILNQLFHSHPPITPHPHTHTPTHTPHTHTHTGKCRTNPRTIQASLYQPHLL